MKCAILAVVAFAALAQSFVIPYELEVKLNGNIIDNVVLEALEFLRKLLKENQPISLPDLPGLAIVDRDINANVKLSSVKLSKADDFEVKSISNDLASLTAKFDVVAPQPHVEGTIELSGQVLNKTVSGTGSFSLDLTNMDQSAEVSITIQNHGILIKDVNLDFNLGGIKIAVSGLTVEGMTDSQVTDFLNNNLLAVLNSHKQFVSQRVAAHIVQQGNEILAGRTIKDLIDLVKQILHL